MEESPILTIDFIVLTYKYSSISRKRQEHTFYVVQNIH